MPYYTIVEADNTYELQNRVNDHIKEGYKPVGNMTVTKVNTDPGFFGFNTIEEKYYQPMIVED